MKNFCVAAGLLCAIAGYAHGQEIFPTARVNDHSHHGVGAQANAGVHPSGLVQPDASAIIIWTFPTPSPETVTINVLETVTWNGNFASHPLEATDSTFSIATQTLTNSGTTFGLGFIVPGTYYFRCGNHPLQMRTTVRVSGPGGPPALAGAASRKAHGLAGTFDLPLLPAPAIPAPGSR